MTLENRKEAQMVKKQNESETNEKKSIRRRVQIFFSQPSLTKQEFKDETDINNIVKRYRDTGELPPQRQGRYEDVSQIPDYHQALEIVKTAQESFQLLPAKVRAEFNNDPGTMLQWLDKPENQSRAYEIGLLVKPLTNPETLVKTHPGASEDKADKRSESEGSKATV